jgi:hypothetical protein
MNDNDILRECTHPDLEIDELIRMARSGQLKRGCGGPINELRRHRAHRLQQANRILRGSLEENRGISSAENSSIDLLLLEARELTGVIDELEAKFREEAADAKLVYDPAVG